MPYTCVMVGLILALPESTSITYVYTLRGDLLYPPLAAVFDGLSGSHSEPLSITLQGYGSDPKYTDKCLDFMLPSERRYHVSSP